MRSACPTCGLPTVREHGQALATTTVNLVLTLSLMLGTLLVVTIATYPDIPVGPVAIVTLAMAVVLPVLFHPFAKTLWLAIDLRLNPLRPGEVSPEHELALLERHEDRGSG